MADLSLRKVKKVYDNTVVAVQAFDLEIADKEFIVLVGPSGCGKSTTLRMVAGLEEITDGEIYIGGRKVNTVPPKDRDIAMVFQNYALGDVLQTGHHAQRGGLPTAGGAHQDDELLVGDLQVERLHRHHRVVVYFLYVTKAQIRHRTPPFP